MMERKPRFGINPPKFVFDKDSTKEFGGMVIDRKANGVYKRPKREGASGPQSGKLKPRKNRRMIP